MANRVDDVIRLCCEVSANQQMKAAVKNSGKGAFVTGLCAFAGGLVAGPAGLALGGAIGGLMGCWMTSGQFKPVPQIIMELPPQHQKKLYNDVMTVLGTLDWIEVTQLIMLVMGNASMKQQIVAAIFNYVTKELRAEVQYGD